MTTPDAPHPTACENCHTALHGHYCHHCGQSAHNPNKHLGHAIEEVFESFWHLDGRIFRTLRDLWVPGRVARNYLHGQRVGYVQPLRLFVILTLFTFFVAKLTIHGDPNGDHRLVQVNDPFATLTTEAEVLAARDASLANLRTDATTPIAMTVVVQRARVEMELAAERRLAQLRGLPEPAAPSEGLGFDIPVNGKPWHPASNPVQLAGWPSFVSDFINHRLQRVQENTQRMGEDGSLYIKAILTALPGALFVLMPVFALVLRVAYANRAMGYLEHLVVALYSHAWLLTVLLVTLLISAATAAVGVGALSGLGSAVAVVLWLCVPVYLFVMQQRVYGGQWWMTALRYSLVGGVYFLLVAAVVTYAALAGISS